MTQGLLPIRTSCKGKATRNEPSARKIKEGTSMWTINLIVEAITYQLEELRIHVLSKKLTIQIEDCFMVKKIKSALCNGVL